MLLMKLESSQKFAFLQLAHYLARADGFYVEVEEHIILEYCTEMGVENSEIFDLNEFDLEYTLSKFKSKKSQKIVVLELMILVHSDNHFDIKEVDLLAKIMDAFEMHYDEIKHFSSWGKAVSALHEQALNLID